MFPKCGDERDASRPQRGLQMDLEFFIIIISLELDKEVMDNSDGMYRDECDGHAKVKYI